MLNTQERKSVVENDNSALVSRITDSDGEKRKKPWCEHCKKPWHIEETCWKLHGKPPNRKKKPGNDNKAFQTSFEDNQGQQVTSEASPFTKEQPPVQTLPFSTI